MAILEDKVNIKIYGANIKHYEEKGYILPKYKDNNRYRVIIGSILEVCVEDLPKGSHHKVTKICDDCGILILDSVYNKLVKYREKYDKDRCMSCHCKFHNEKRLIKESLEDFAIKNNRINLLDEYSKRNKKQANQVHKSSNKKVWWNCPDCNSEYDMSVDNRTLLKFKCPYCNSNRVNETNCLWTTNPKIAELLVDKEFGYKITKGHNGKAEFKCNNCESIQSNSVNNVVRRGFSCSKCSDNISYPEKFIMNLLDQLNIKYRYQYAPFWAKNKKYDFFISNLNLIIEVHGIQHYKKSNRGRKLEEEKENDEHKKYLAKNNEIYNYIELNCTYSEMDYIKSSILRSKLNNLIDISNVDWLRCHEFALSSFVRKASDLWNSGYRIVEISEKLNLHVGTVRRYLKHATKIGWCNYVPKNKSKVKIAQLTNEYKLIKTWGSILEVCNYLNLSQPTVKKYCEQNKYYNGYIWMLEKDYKKNNSR